MLDCTETTLRNVDLTKKKICKIFDENGLKIRIKANKKIVDFLDVTLDVRTSHAKSPTAI